MRNNLVPLPVPDPQERQRPPLVLPVRQVVAGVVGVALAWLSRYDQGLAAQLLLALCGYTALDSAWAGLRR